MHWFCRLLAVDAVACISLNITHRKHWREQESSQTHLEEWCKIIISLSSRFWVLCICIVVFFFHSFSWRNLIEIIYSLYDAFLFQCKLQKTAIFSVYFVSIYVFLYQDDFLYSSFKDISDSFWEKNKIFQTICNALKYMIRYSRHIIKQINIQMSDWMEIMIRHLRNEFSSWDALLKASNSFTHSKFGWLHIT